MKVQPYHQYVFDVSKRKFIGDFERMYAAEDRENFDSWHQEDIRHLGRQMALLLISRYSFGKILDIGCGKGVFTQFLKKQNNDVLGVDVSLTAITKARERYPDVSFSQDTADGVLRKKGRWDLIVIIEVLSYLAEWKSIVKKMSQKGDRVLISLYLPSDPIGFVKSFHELKEQLQKYFLVEEEIFWNGNTMFLLMRSKQNK